MTFLAVATPDLLVAPTDFCKSFQIKQASTWTPVLTLALAIKFIHIIFNKIKSFMIKHFLSFTLVVPPDMESVPPTYELNIAIFINI